MIIHVRRLEWTRQAGWRDILRWDDRDISLFVEAAQTYTTPSNKHKYRAPLSHYEFSRSQGCCERISRSISISLGIRIAINKMLALTGVERSYASALDAAMHDLSVRAEVGSVMEGMLGDLEAWEWANREEALQKELEHARAQVAVLQESERSLLEVGWFLAFDYHATAVAAFEFSAYMFSCAYLYDTRTCCTMMRYSESYVLPRTC